LVRRYDPELDHRRSIRMRGWDCGAGGAYFVTIVSYERELLFGTVVDGAVALSPLGLIVHEEWVASGAIRREIGLDLFVLMPNHVHGIVWIANDGSTSVGATGRSPRVAGTDVRATGRSPLQSPRGPATRSLGAFVGGFKVAATTRINMLRGMPRAPVWQRNYYERVIRDERELEVIRVYIQDNPGRWAEDTVNSERVRRRP